MRTSILISTALVAGLMLTFGVYKFTLSGDPKADVVPVQDARPGGQGGGFGGFRGGGMGGPGGMMGQRDGFGEAVAALAECNLEPDFNLTADQKTKIQGIRDGVKKARETWRKDHEEDIKKVQEEMRAARDGQDRDKAREAFQKLQELGAGAPKTDDAEKQLKAVLTADQAKKLDAKVEERFNQMEENRRQMMDRMGGGGPGGPGGPGGGQPGGGQGGGRGKRGGAGGGGGANQGWLKEYRWSLTRAVTGPNQRKVRAPQGEGGR